MLEQHTHSTIAKPYKKIGYAVDRNSIQRDCFQSDQRIFVIIFAERAVLEQPLITWLPTHIYMINGFAMGSVDYETAPARIKKGLARHPIPVVVLALLAVDIEYQNSRIGIDLMKDTLSRSLSVSKHIGARAVFVNAKCENVKKFMNICVLSRYRVIR